MDEQRERLSFSEVERLTREANCNDRRWLGSFLNFCTDEADGRNSIKELRDNCPGKFTRQAPCAPSEPRLGKFVPLNYAVVDSLTREAAPVDFSTLRTYVNYQKTHPQPAKRLKPCGTPTLKFGNS
jgi:hypothetical protein